MFLLSDSDATRNKNRDAIQGLNFSNGEDCSSGACIIDEPNFKRNTYRQHGSLWITVSKDLTL